jgi:hypothetical protein
LQPDFVSGRKILNGEYNRLLSSRNNESCWRVASNRLRPLTGWLHYEGFPELLSSRQAGRIPGGRPLQKKKRLRSGELTVRLQRRANEKAATEARRVPWQVLLEARNHYLDWQEFSHWARSIIDVEQAIPDWLTRKLGEACPGFPAVEKQYLLTHPKEATLVPVRLSQWIDERVFGFAKQGGWLLAITFYAVRETRYQKASACWAESVQKWKKARPVQYPSFEEWRRDAARCDETARLLPAIRKQRECFKLVSTERLAQAVSSLIDWEAVAYWARPALEAGSSLPSEVARELDSRCPGFLESNTKQRGATERSSDHWQSLMLWIRDHFFQDRPIGGMVRRGPHFRPQSSPSHSCNGILRSLRGDLEI